MLQLLAFESIRVSSEKILKYLSPSGHSMYRANSVFMGWSAWHWIKYRATKCQVPGTYRFNLRSLLCFFASNTPEIASMRFWMLLEQMLFISHPPSPAPFTRVSLFPCMCMRLWFLPEEMQVWDCPNIPNNIYFQSFKAVQLQFCSTHKTIALRICSKSWFACKASTGRTQLRPLELFTALR